MKQFYAALAPAAVLICSALAGPASAAPPTVVPSPGYDARLQEQRAARQPAASAQRVYQPAHRRAHKPARGVTR